MMRKAFTSQLGQNVISNYLGVVWMGGLSLVLIPVYLKLLGPAQWGLVAACMSMQAFMSLLDMGLGQIMPRNIALACGHQPGLARSFVLFSRFYLVLGGLGFLLGQAAIPWIVQSWLHQGDGLSVGADVAFRLVLLQFVFQFANNAHVGYWNGVQEQRLANVRQCAFATLKHAGALAMIIALEPSAANYLLPFVIVSAVEYSANRWTIWRDIRCSTIDRFGLGDYRQLASEAGLLAVGVLAGMLVSQVDRIVLVRAVDIETFGRYVIVANFGLAFMQLQYPLVRAYFPRIVLAKSRNDKGTIRRLANGILLSCVIPCALFALFAPVVLEAWTHDSAVVQGGVVPLRFILGAVAVNAIYQLIYQQILSHGPTGLILKINVIVLLAVIPTAFFSTAAWGSSGAGFTWLAASIVQLVVGMLLWRRDSL